VNNDDNVGFSGFTHAGCPKVVPVEIARRAEEEHAKGNPFKIGVFTGASTGDSIDGSLARARAIKFRTPYQTNKDMREALNRGESSIFSTCISPSWPRRYVTAFWARSISLLWRPAR